MNINNSENSKDPYVQSVKRVILPAILSVSNHMFSSYAMQMITAAEE